MIVVLIEFAIFVFHFFFLPPILALVEAGLKKVNRELDTNKCTFSIVVFIELPINPPKLVAVEETFKFSILKFLMITLFVDENRPLGLIWILFIL